MNAVSNLAMIELSCMLCKILRLQSSLEESKLNEKQLKHKLETQTETLNNKLEELRALNEQTGSSMTSEMMEVQIKIIDLENAKVGRRNFFKVIYFLEIMYKIVTCDFDLSRWSWNRNYRNVNTVSSSWNRPRATSSCAWNTSLKKRRRGRKRLCPGSMHSR